MAAPLRPVAAHDAAQLYGEDERVNHTSSRLLRFARSAAPLTAEEVRAHLRRRLPELQVLRDRPARVSANLAHPVWVDGGAPDLAWHVRERELPVPGGEHELRALVAELAASPLDQQRPLWDLTLVRDHEEDAELLVLRMHHALGDGTAASNLLAALFDDRAGAERDTPAAERPAGRALGRYAARRSTRAAARLPELLRRSTSRRRGASQLGDQGTGAPATAFGSPQVPWAQRLVPGRSWARTTLSLDALDEVRRPSQATVTATLCALVGAALRAELLAGPGLPARSLTATVAVARPAGDPSRLRGNALAMVFVPLHSDEPSPRARLTRVQADLRATTYRSSELDADVWELWWELYPLQRLAHKGADAVMRRLRRPVASAIISTVRGPRGRLALGGRELTGLWSTGPVVDMLGLNVTAWSLGRELHVSLLSQPALADVDRLAQRLDAALAELAAAT